MAKRKDTVIRVSTFFDGPFDATEVFAELIIQKILKKKDKEYIANQQAEEYNRDAADHSVVPTPTPGMCRSRA